MQTVGQIIRERREKLGLTLTAVAEEIGATKAYLSMIENHKVNNPPSRKLVEGLERALKISKGELVRTAEWETTPTAVRKEFKRVADSARKGQELAEWLKESSGKRQGGGRNLDKLFKSGALQKRLNETLKGGRKGDVDARVPVRYQVPLINKVAAGYPRDFTDLGYPARVADEYVACPGVNDPQAFAARVVGDSMEPDYREGDIVIFSPAAKVAEGADCFVRLETSHESTFKRVFFDKHDIRLQPLNPRFKPRTLKRDQVAGLYRAVVRFQSLV